MSILLWGVGIVGWLALGWWGGRRMKRLFINDYGSEEGWDSEAEVFGRLFMFLGPVFLAISLLLFPPVRWLPKRSWF